jgi:hypothetical protein
MNKYPKLHQEHICIEPGDVLSRVLEMEETMMRAKRGAARNAHSRGRGFRREVAEAHRSARPHPVGAG